MCKKLIGLCLAIVVVGLSVPASADYIGLNNNPLAVDINGRNGNATLPGYQEWYMPGSPAVPLTQQFVNLTDPLPWMQPIAEWTVVTSVAGATPGSRALARERAGGFGAVGSTGDYSSGTMGYGRNYEKVSFSQLAPNQKYTFFFWSADGDVWSSNSSNPDSRFGCWSTTNPNTWLVNNGWGQGGANTSIPNGGYGPIVNGTDVITSTDSNMPGKGTGGLYDLVLGVGAEGGRTTLHAYNNSSAAMGLDMHNRVKFQGTTDSDGKIVIYGWIDPSDWAGSAHMPMNGFMVIPEPVTIALLGLGGLALLRRKKA